MIHINSKICIALTTALSLSIAMVNESKAAEIIKSGCDCGENCCYTYDENGVLTLSRADNTKSANIKDGMFSPMWGNTWTEFNMKEVTIPEGFTSIGNHAFQDQNISSLTTPNSMETIGESAFENVGSLTSVTLNDGLKEIGYDAFAASSIASLIVPETVVNVGWYGLNGPDKIVINDSIDTCDWDSGAIPSDVEVIYRGSKDNFDDCLKEYISSDDGGTCTQNCPIFLPANESQCTGNYGWSGASCVRKDEEGKVACASGYVEWEKDCLSEYPFAKKRWTPAEAAQWLHDGNDNFVILTFKK